MQQTQPDKWSSRSITSTLQVSIRDHKPTCIDNGLIVYTPNCGFGWRFGIDGSAEQVTSYREQGAAAGQQISKTTLRLYFDPNLIAKAEFGTASIGVRSNFDDALVKDTPLQAPSPPIMHSCKLPGSRIQLGTYVFAGDFDKPLVAHITVSFTEALDLRMQASPSASVTQVLRDSILGIETIDIKFILFSTRSALGAKGKSQPLYANSRVLEGHSTDLDAFLSNVGFKESAIVSLDNDISLEVDEDLYDYDSDSDLDPDEEPSVDKTPDSPPPSSSSLSPSATDAAVKDQTTGPQRTGRVFSIRDTAYRTWRCLLYYLYGEAVTFTPLTSSLSANTPKLDGACSPKSMYRLAEKYGLEDLARLAKNAIEAQLSRDNIVEELFSSFTFRYDEIIHIEVAFFCAHYDSPTVSEAFMKALDRLVTGELLGRAGVLKAIYFQLMYMKSHTPSLEAAKTLPPPSLESPPSEVFGTFEEPLYRRGRGRGRRS